MTPVFLSDGPFVFPPVEEAAESGLLAVGGDLSVDRLLSAYRGGIFPWYEEGLPILWHAPDPRMILETTDLHVGRSLQKTLRRSPLRVRLDTAFEQVIARCAAAERPGQDGTWITGDMAQAYIGLHEDGYAHSAEAWLDDTLVGGLYGVCLGGAFFGESMYADTSDASKVAFVTLVHQLRRWSVGLVDCQVHTEHLARFGATEIPRQRFMERLEVALAARPTLRGPWSLDGDLQLPWSETE